MLSNYEKGTFFDEMFCQAGGSTFAHYDLLHKRSSKYNKETKSIETKIIKPSLNFSNFINLVKRNEDTYETELIMKNWNIWLGKKVNYEKSKDPKITRGIF